jgi:LysM repeat protein
MALASQVPRPDLLRSPSSRRTRRNNSRARFVVGLLIIAVIVVAGWQGVKWKNRNATPETPTADGPGESASPVNEIAANFDESPPLTLDNPGPRDRGLQGVIPSDPTSTTTREVPPVADPTPEEAPPERVETPVDPPSDSPTGIRGLMTRAAELEREGKLVDARALLNRALHNSQTSPGDRERLRIDLSEINQKLVFEPVLMHTDAFMRSYEVQSGDSFWKIARQDGVYVNEDFLMRINQNSGTLRLGQTLKLPTKPFHAVVHKRAYRLDLYMGEVDRREEWMYVRSFPVGLGEFDSTPEGSWVVTEDRKTTNPDWRNPRTGEYFRADDPDNPIGEYWIALTGTDANTRARSGYGIHGTVEPQSIGQSMSMGCIRMLPNDIQMVYEMLAEVDSTVWIVED